MTKVATIFQTLFHPRLAASSNQFSASESPSPTLANAARTLAEALLKNTSLCVFSGDKVCYSKNNTCIASVQSVLIAAEIT